MIYVLLYLLGGILTTIGVMYTERKALEFVDFGGVGLAVLFWPLWALIVIGELIDELNSKVKIKNIFYKEEK